MDVFYFSGGCFEACSGKLPHETEIFYFSGGCVKASSGQRQIFMRRNQEQVLKALLEKMMSPAIPSMSSSSSNGTKWLSASE